MKPLYLLIFLIFISCSSQKEVISLPFPIEEGYFQNWIGGQRLTGRGTDFYIQFKEPFSANFRIRKLYFHEQKLELLKKMIQFTPQVILKDQKILKLKLMDKLKRQKLQNLNLN